ncbi:hypothetical protein GUITHDRAFT_155966 [Guillardia theta CCMP2712]|uniref:Uncharacterized protein n=1 Tax=Guillardia theta (strain CCMP2712) TaxID=905079 RepID=L1IBP6_GUITC|nr:hypothetical protein GUITHDRAFT_155966 [Guillardia theta CCMP2712]EKX33676.1 hypothetical protein GUITHDRAFT_155966 [Guillardia theta CCMP2712]|eukprot:XP_005820656.1 hypothetical protein GUITHDRAFT_155966 [Guillardia theta CCMP2712]
MIRSSIGLRQTVQFQQKRLIWDRIKEIFVQAPNLSPSQSAMNALGFRREAPASKSIKEVPVIPRTAPGAQFKIRYFDRDTVKPTDWNYKDSEGKVAAVSPLKYMDGTPYLTQFAPVPDMPAHLPRQSADWIRPGLPPCAGHPYKLKPTVPETYQD